MTENAWPFLIGRSRNAGYRVVVVPDFMADTASTNALSGATGAVNLPADAACVRELLGLAVGPVSVVYRNLNPRGADFGMSGQGALTDGFGRMIRVTEGLVVRRATGDGAPLEIGPADLERAHAEVAGAYREFWEQDQAYVRRTSIAYPLAGGADRATPPVHLVSAAPWSREPVSAGPPTRYSPRDSSADELSAPHPAERRISRRTAAVIVAVGLALIAAVVAYDLRGKPTSPVASVLGKFCSALTAGRPDTAYGYTDAQFHLTVTSDVFTQEVLSGAAKASRCTYTVDPSKAATANGTVTVTTGVATPTAWSVTLTQEQDASWLISTLTVPVTN